MPPLFPSQINKATKTWKIGLTLFFFLSCHRYEEWKFPEVPLFWFDFLRRPQGKFI
jgi:hypothetical protein